MNFSSIIRNLTKTIFSLRDAGIRYKVLVKNFSYLSTLQFFNILLPLVTYPYLIRTLGKDLYGLVIFAQAIVNYFLILINFGFNISATKEVSKHRHDVNKLNEIVSSVIIIKCLLLFISLAILILTFYLIPKLSAYKLLIFLSMMACINDIFFPTWYFQGIENMKFITFITLLSRLISLLLVFILIKYPADYILVPFFLGIGYFISGITALFIVFSIHKIKFQIQSIKVLKIYVKDAIPIFISNVSISLYISTNKIITGSMLSMGEVAFYDLGEKLINVLKIPQGILSQTLFPKVSKDKNLHFIKRIFKFSIIINCLLFFIFFIFSNKIILILGGKQMIQAHTVVNILALTVPIIAVSNVFGMQILIPLGYIRSFTKIIVLSALFYFFQLIIVYLTIGFSLILISIIILNTEILVAGGMIYIYIKKKVWINYMIS